MSKNLTPFLVTVSGVDHLIEAANLGTAVMRVLPAVTKCKAATGKEYAAFVRAGGTVITAGEPPIDATQLKLQEQKPDAEPATADAEEEAETRSKRAKASENLPPADAE